MNPMITYQEVICGDHSDNGKLRSLAVARGDY